MIRSPVGNRFLPLGLLFLSCVCGTARLHAADLCDPNRPFCGRITIIIVAAGEFENYHGIKGVDSDLTSSSSSYAYADFHMFRRHEGAPAYLIVVTSDPKLAARLEHLPKKIKAEAGFLGTVPASQDAIQDLLSDDPSVSLLQKAVNNFSNNPRCQSLMESQRVDSVLPLLKTEIVIEGHNGLSGVPLWSNKSETGTATAWAEKADPSMLDKNLSQSFALSWETV
jgi:hypothetical protein